MDEQFDRFTRHLPSPFGASLVSHLRRPPGGAIIGVCMGNVLERGTCFTNPFMTAESRCPLSTQTTYYQNQEPCQQEV
jgi:hypothetical protein